jgi:Ribosomal protein S21.
MEEGIIDIVREKVHYEKPSRKRYKRQKEIDHRIDINERRSNG